MITTEKPYPSCESERLMFPASFKRSPAAPVCFCLSEPARSTKLILLICNRVKPSAALCNRYMICSSLAEDLKQQPTCDQSKETKRKQIMDFQFLAEPTENLSLVHQLSNIQYRWLF